MPLFLVTSLYDEGISPDLFQVVEAESKLAVAGHMLEYPDQRGYFLYRSFHRESVDAALALTVVVKTKSRERGAWHCLVQMVADQRVNANSSPVSAPIEPMLSLLVPMTRTSRSEESL